MSLFNNSLFALRIGHGYDIHSLKEGRQLILGGVTIPHSMGLDGHSDADCLLHALSDAILGAVGLPDIGHYFPSTDPAIKGIDSAKILQKAAEEAIKEGYMLANADLTLVAETPKLKPYIDPMKERIANILGVDTKQIGIKATTNEQLGTIGRKEGIAAFAVVLMHAIHLP